MNWTPDEIHGLANSMVARPNGFRVSARTAPLIIQALRSYAESLAPSVGAGAGYTVEVWDATRNRRVEMLAEAAIFAIAEAAFRAAVLARPNAPVTLRQRTRVLLATFRD